MSTVTDIQTYSEIDALSSSFAQKLITKESSELIYDKIADLGTSKMAEKLVSKGYNLYFPTSYRPIQSEMMPVAIISKTKDHNRFIELRKTVRKYAFTPKRFEVFVVVPRHYQEFYKNALAKEIDEGLLTLVLYYVTNVDLHIVNKKRFIINRYLNVGDARNAVLALGCALNTKYLIMSDDDRNNLNPYFTNQPHKNGQVKWVMSGTFEEKAEDILKHIDLVLSGKLIATTKPVAMLGFMSFNRQHWKVVTNPDSYIFHESHTNHCAQYVALNMQVLKEREIIYLPLRMAEDNAFQYSVTKAGMLCFESGHLAHNSASADKVPSTCRNTNNSKFDSYTKEDHQIWYDFLELGLISYTLSKGKDLSTNNRVRWQIKWSNEGDRTFCPNAIQFSICEEEKDRKEKVIEKMNKKWEAFMIARNSYLENLEKKRRTRKKPEHPIDNRLEHLDVDPFDKDFDPKKLNDYNIDIAESAGWQNLGQLLFEFLEKGIITLKPNGKIQVTRV